MSLTGFNFSPTHYLVFKYVRAYVQNKPESFNVKDTKSLSYILYINIRLGVFNIPNSIYHGLVLTLYQGHLGGFGSGSL